jgi:hypothetical protein
MIEAAILLGIRLNSELAVLFHGDRFTVKEIRIHPVTGQNKSMFIKYATGTSGKCEFMQSKDAPSSIDLANEKNMNSKRLGSAGFASAVSDPKQGQL